MIDFKNSETAKNLMRAFAGESQARNRYTIAAGQAKKDGLPVVQSVFLFTANVEFVADTASAHHAGCEQYQQAVEEMWYAN